MFDDEAVVRSMLKRICLRRGYEVHTFSRLNLCAKCRCKKGEACTDIVISDVNMPGFTGIEFLVNQLMRNCKVKKMALMSGAWKEADRQMARSLGCKVFEKPIDLDSLTKWLKKCESNINVEGRILVPWFLEDASEA